MIILLFIIYYYLVLFIIIYYYLFLFISYFLFLISYFFLLLLLFEKYFSSFLLSSFLLSPSSFLSLLPLFPPPLPSQKTNSFLSLSPPKKFPVDYENWVLALSTFHALFCDSLSFQKSPMDLCVKRKRAFFRYFQEVDPEILERILESTKQGNLVPLSLGSLSFF